jgi:hypothetical protein
MLRFKFLFWFFLVTASHLYSQDDPVKLGLFQLNVGTDYRINRLTYFGSKDQQFAQFGGGFVRMQTSFFNLFFAKPNAKLEFGDVVVGELSGGYTHAPYHGNIQKGITAFYNFELGFAVLYHMKKNIDIQLGLALLKFGRDLISGFWGGSHYTARIRYKKCLFDLALISENHLYFGFLNKNDLVKDQNIHKPAFGFSYFIKPKNVLGIRFETMPVAGVYSFNGLYREQVFTSKLFYGIIL